MPLHTDISALFSPQALALGVKSSSKRQVLQQLSEQASKQVPLLPERLLEGLHTQNDAWNSAVHHGVAIIEGRLMELDKPLATLMFLDKPIDLGASDRLPVECLCAIWLPEPREHGSSSGQYLWLITQLSRLLRDERVQKQLRGCVNADAAYSVLVQAQADKAA